MERVKEYKTNQPPNFFVSCSCGLTTRIFWASGLGRYVPEIKSWQFKADTEQFWYCGQTGHKQERFNEI